MKKGGQGSTLRHISLKTLGVEEINEPILEAPSGQLHRDMHKIILKLEKI